MANPLIGFINLTDQFGTRIAALGVSFHTGTTDFTAKYMWEPASEFIAGIGHTIVSYALLAMSMITNGALTKPLMDAYQYVLDSIYQYVDPLVIASIAFLIVLLRHFIGDRISREKVGTKTHV